MNSDAKYIIWDDAAVGKTAVVFPPTLTHAAVANSLGILNDVISAGFVSYNDVLGTFHCYGESISLRKKSIPEVDSGFISRILLGK